MCAAWPSSLEQQTREQLCSRQQIRTVTPSTGSNGPLASRWTAPRKRGTRASVKDSGLYDITHIQLHWTFLKKIKYKKKPYTERKEPQNSYIIPTGGNYENPSSCSFLQHNSLISSAVSPSPSIHSFNHLFDVFLKQSLTWSLETVPPPTSIQQFSRTLLSLCRFVVPMNSFNGSIADFRSSAFYKIVSYSIYNYTNA